MSNSALARALANRSGRALETWMPAAPTQGPVPKFLEAAMPPAPQQGPPPVFARGGWGAPEGYQNNSMPPMAPSVTPMMAAARQAPSAPPVMSPMTQPDAPPVSMEMQGVPAFAQSAPTARNELERDYYRKLAQDPGIASWLARNFG